MVPGASEPVRALLDASFDQLQELEHAEEIERLTQLIDQRFGTVIQAVERRESTPEAVERTLTNYLQQHAARHQSDLSAVTQEVRGMSAVLRSEAFQEICPAESNAFDAVSPSSFELVIEATVFLIC